MRPTLLALLAAFTGITSTSCKQAAPVAPPPPVVQVMEVRATFRASATETADLSATNSLANLGWWQVMNDAQLKTYISEALSNSWDIKIAAAAVLLARV